MTVVVVLISRLKSGEYGSMCPLKREQARCETQQWVMGRLPTADSIVEIGRKSRSWINGACCRCCTCSGVSKTVGVSVCCWLICSSLRCSCAPRCHYCSTTSFNTPSTHSTNYSSQPASRRSKSLWVSTTITTDHCFDQLPPDTCS